jgi:hypothetical protein
MSRCISSVGPKAIVTVLVFFIHGHSAAQPSGWQSWKEIASTDQFSYRVDPASIDRSKAGIVKAWVLVTPVTESSRLSYVSNVENRLRQKRLSATGVKNWSYQMALTEIDCGNDTQRILTEMDFDASGTVLDSPGFRPYELQYLFPRSTVKSGLNDICSGAQ